MEKEMEKEINKLKREIGKFKKEKQELEKYLGKTEEEKKRYERWYRDEVIEKEQLEKSIEELHRMLDFFPNPPQRKSVYEEKEIELTVQTRLTMWFAAKI